MAVYFLDRDDHTMDIIRYDAPIDDPEYTIHPKPRRDDGTMDITRSEADQGTDAQESLDFLDEIPREHPMFVCESR
jgi:hypothetical protein